MPLAEPQAEQRPVDRTLHDLRLIDEYAWLKAENWREVMRALAGLTDSRVLYWEPAKWIARLRRLRTEDNLLAFRTNLDAGQGEDRNLRYYENRQPIRAASIEAPRRAWCSRSGGIRIEIN